MKIKNVIRIFVILLMLTMCANTATALAETYYDSCEEGVSEDGYKIVKVSSEEIEEMGAFEAIQAVLDEARENATESLPYKIVIEPGEYCPRICLKLYSNTYVYMDGVTLTQQSDYDGNIMKIGDGGDLGDTKKGYYYNNIIVYGGTLDKNGNEGTIIKGGHAKNFAIYNMTIQNNYNSHGMEVGGIDGFTVEGCTFKDLTADSNHSDANEAIQIDILNDGHMTGYQIEALEMKNISITGNSFSNVIRGVGSHSVWYGLYTENIVISNNTFTDIRDAAIVCLNYVNCKIENNTITRCGRGIYVDSMNEIGTDIYTHNKPYSINYDTKTVINNNKMIIVDTSAKFTPSGITLHGVNFTTDLKVIDKNKKVNIIPKGNYYLGGVIVSNNVISSPGYGIRALNTKNSSFSNNKITLSDKKKTYHAIVLGSDSSNVNVIKNTIGGCYKFGILVYESSQGGTISHNNVSGDFESGVYVKEGNAKNINNNTISGSKANGIVVVDSITSTIYNNVVTKAGKSGIYVSEGGRVAIIKNNTITNPAEKGIIVFYNTKGAGVKEISYNRISNSGGNAISVQGAVCDMNVVKNVITYCKGHGIFLGLKDVKYKVNVLSNTIAGIGDGAKAGVLVSNAYVVADTNNISKFGWGINVSAGKSKGYIKSKNVFKANSNYNIRICGTVRGIKVKKLVSPVVKSKKRVSKGIKIKWGKVTDATHYIIYRSSKKNGKFTKLATLDGKSALSYTDNKAKKGKTYYYKLVAISKVKGNQVYVTSEAGKAR